MSPRNSVPLAGVGRAPITRLSVNLAPTVATALKETAAREGLNVTEAIRHAIALWKLVTDARAAGERLVICGGEYDREVVLA